MRKSKITKMRAKKTIEQKLRKEKKRAEKKRKYKAGQIELAAKLKARGEQPHSSKKRKRNV